MKIVGKQSLAKGVIQRFPGQEPASVCVARPIGNIRKYLTGQGKMP